MIATNVAVHMSTEQMLSQLSSNAREGLLPVEVEARRLQYPANELEAEVPEPLYKKFLDTFKDPLIMLLLGSCLVRRFDFLRCIEARVCRSVALSRTCDSLLCISFPSCRLN